MPRNRSRSNNRRRSRSVKPRSNNTNNQLGNFDVQQLLADVIKSTILNQIPVPTLKINCQLAHGSPTAVIRNYQSIPELHEKIADVFDISPHDIMFLTVNTFKPIMDNIFNGCIMNDDFLYVHVAGQACELEVEKTEKSLGITIADNGVSRCFIKKIMESSVLDKLRPNISVGQLIEKINGVDVIGLRHYEVARMLRLIPIGTTFTIHLISPLQYQMGIIQPRSAIKKLQTKIDGTETIRMKRNGECVVEKAGEHDAWISQVNELLDDYLGIHDNQLAMSILDLAKKSNEITDLIAGVKESDLEPFKFPQTFINNVWNIYTQHKRQGEELTS